jgi:putative transposase
MVADLSDYPWSSFPAHALGEPGPLLTELPCWSMVGTTEEARQAYWRTWAQTPLSQRELAAVRRSVTSGRPFGAAAWVDTMAAALGLRLWTRPRGRPRKDGPP